MERAIGGKNFALAELKNQLHLNVPEAFFITTSAFHEMVKHNNLRERIASLDDGTGAEGTALNELREQILQAEIPPSVDTAIERALEEIRARHGGTCRLAVRSSADEEDREFSFAGQFETILNVPADLVAVRAAYRKVVASLFSANAVAYEKHLGFRPGKMQMAVGCLVMVDAVSSGVIYSSDPAGDPDTLLVNAAWGLGTAVVEGQTDADLYRIKKGAGPSAIEIEPGKKEYMVINLEEGGTGKVRTPEEMKDRPCLVRETVKELSTLGVTIETYFRRPQDIEWALGKDGVIYALQSRPLRIGQKTAVPSVLPAPADTAKEIMRDSGIAVQKGIASGRVFIVKYPDELRQFPKGSVLVSRHDSSNFVRVMPYVGAIITDTGTPTSHMASLCREFRIPTIVNAGDATKVLHHGQEVTVAVDDEGKTAVFEGVFSAPQDFAHLSSLPMEDVYEFRKKRSILRYIAPLNLVDPLIDSFTPEGCRTLHDVLRFIHEKAVMELVDRARYGTDIVKKQAAVKLDLPIPAGIIVLDIGGAFLHAGKAGIATYDHIASLPFRAIVKGMLHPGVWDSEAVSLRVNDFISSMMRMPDLTTDRSDYVGYNVAVVSSEYMNLNLKFGYHFTIVDCYCSDNTRNNHIYFRFAGGATDITKRSRRIQLIADILRRLGFGISANGDLVIARLTNVSADEIEGILEQLGRLLAYTRQLDAVLHDDASVERYTRKFLEGDYGRM
jgi:pyruvate,water dikinase